MTLNDIVFYERAGYPNSGLGLHVRGYWVLKIFFELALTNALREIPLLDWSKHQTTETLCGEVCWKAYPYDHNRLGRCMKFFVDEEMLPLRVANPKKKGKRKFTRKD